MDTSFQKTAANDEWYTPREIIEALGPFDLDPCAPMKPLWRTAARMVNKEQDGLKNSWGGGESMVQSSLFSATSDTLLRPYGGERKRDSADVRQGGQRAVSGSPSAERGCGPVPPAPDTVLPSGRHEGGQCRLRKLPAVLWQAEHGRAAAFWTGRNTYQSLRNC